MPPKAAKSKEAPAESPILGRFSSHLKIGIVKAWLDEEKDVRLGDWNALVIEILNTIQLLTAKPVVYLVNVNEKDYQRKTNKFLPKIHAWVQEHGGETIIPFSCALERKLADLPADEAAKYCEENKLNRD